MNTLWSLEKIGIGTAITSCNLHVEGKAWLSGSNNPLTVDQWENATVCELNAGAHTVMCVNSNGCVGINTTMPLGGLHVKGFSSSYVAGFAYFNSVADGGSSTGQTIDVSVYGSTRAIASEFNSVSDRREKERIADISLVEALELVNGVSGKQYHFKNDIAPEPNTRYGFIAQELLFAGFSNMVTPIPLEDPLLIEQVIEGCGVLSPCNVCLNINYSKFIPFHTKVIQHLMDCNDYVDTLRNQVEALQVQVDLTDAAIAQLTAA